MDNKLLRTKGVSSVVRKTGKILDWHAIENGIYIVSCVNVCGVSIRHALGRKRVPVTLQDKHDIGDWWRADCAFNLWGDNDKKWDQQVTSEVWMGARYLSQLNWDLGTWRSRRTATRPTTQRPVAHYSCPQCGKFRRGRSRVSFYEIHDPRVSRAWLPNDHHTSKPNLSHRSYQTSHHQPHLLLIHHIHYSLVTIHS